MMAERHPSHPARPSAKPILHQINFAPGGRDLEAEAFQLVIPQINVRRPRQGGVYRALDDLPDCHDSRRAYYM